jgi:hypothetical protein
VTRGQVNRDVRGIALTQLKDSTTTSRAWGGGNGGRGCRKGDEGGRGVYKGEGVGVRWGGAPRKGGLSKG